MLNQFLKNKSSLFADKRYDGKWDEEPDPSPLSSSRIMNYER